MSSSNRSSKDVDKARTSQIKDRQSTAATAAESSGPCQSNSSDTILSIYNVRFPANICEHQSPLFVRRPEPLPGRGGGAIVVPTEKCPGQKVSPRTNKAQTKTGSSSPRVVDAGSDRQVQQKRQTTVERVFSRDAKMATDGKIIKREAKNR